MLLTSHLRNRWTGCSFVLTGALVGILLGGGCNRLSPPLYNVQILGPIQSNVLTGATTLSLSLDDREMTRVAVKAGAPAQLDLSGIKPKSRTPASVLIRAEDATGKLVAFGKTPPLDLELLSADLAVFIQPPGTLGRTDDLSAPLRGQVALATVAELTTPTDPFSVIVMPVFAGGQVLLPGLATGATVEDYLNDVLVYDPFTHLPESIGTLGSGQSSTPIGRADATALALPNGHFLIFGGLARTSSAVTPVPSGLADLFSLLRNELAAFQAPTLSSRNPTDPAVARSRAPLGLLGSTAFAFGGLAGATVLDSVVAISTDPQSGELPTLIAPRMDGPRLGHTVTFITTATGASLLVYGGAPAGVAVAELLTAERHPVLAPTMGDGGPPRRDHTATTVTIDGQTAVLFVGGRDGTGMALDSSWLYFPLTQEFRAGPLTLKHARYGHVTFVLNGDLVISGGIDASGALVPGAEIYNSRDLTFVTETPAYPRAFPTATPLPNESVVLIGGEQANGTPVAAVEIYQPRR